MINENKYNKSIKSLLDATESLLSGNFEQAKVEVDAEGLISKLARKINAMILNMKAVELPLSSAGEHAPNALIYAESVIELMAQSTNNVLNASDKLFDHLEKLENSSIMNEESSEEVEKEIKERLPDMKSAMFTIVTSQSYQDVARQKMEALTGDLRNIRNWLIDALIILNLKKDSSEKNIQEKATLLKQVKNKEMSDLAKQDLVDDLLSEFGL